MVSNTNKLKVSHYIPLEAEQAISDIQMAYLRQTGKRIDKSEVVSSVILNCKDSILASPSMLEGLKPADESCKKT